MGNQLKSIIGNDNVYPVNLWSNVYAGDSTGNNVQTIKDKIESIEAWIANIPNNLPLATSLQKGVIRLGYIQTGTNYPVQITSDTGMAFVNVPATAEATVISGNTRLGSVWGNTGNRTPFNGSSELDIQFRVEDGIVFNTIPLAGTSEFLDTAYIDGGLISRADYARLQSTAGLNTFGMVKTSSTVNNSSGYTATPIIGGIPYYKDLSAIMDGNNKIKSEYLPSYIDDIVSLYGIYDTVPTSNVPPVGSIIYETSTNKLKIRATSGWSLYTVDDSQGTPQKGKLYYVYANGNVVYGKEGIYRYTGTSLAFIPDADASIGDILETVGIHMFCNDSQLPSYGFVNNKLVPGDVEDASEGSLVKDVARLGAKFAIRDTQKIMSDFVGQLVELFYESDSCYTVENDDVKMNIASGNITQEQGMTYTKIMNLDAVSISILKVTDVATDVEGVIRFTDNSNNLKGICYLNNENVSDSFYAVIPKGATIAYINHPTHISLDFSVYLTKNFVIA